MNTRNYPYEVTLALFLVVAVLATWASAVLLLILPDRVDLVVQLEVGALFLIAVGIAMGVPMAGVHKLRRKTRGSRKYERERRESGLRIAGALHSLLLAIGAALGFVLYLDQRKNQGEIGLPLVRITAALVALYVTNAAYAFYQSANLPRDKPLDKQVWIISLSLTIIGALAAAAAWWIGPFGNEIGGLLFDPRAGSILLVVTLVTVGIALVMSRRLPTLLTTLTQLGEISRTESRKAIWLPTAISFTLLLVFVLLMLLFGVGVVDVFTKAGENQYAILLLAGMMMLVFVGIGVSMYLNRPQGDVELFIVRKTPEDATRQLIIGISIFVAGIFLFYAYWLYSGKSLFAIPQERWLDMASIGILAGVGPYGFYAARRASRTQQMEVRFPDFLRDLASSHRGGLTLAQAVRVSARGEYGPLTTEIQRMADQLSWNVSFNDALARMRDRVATPLVQRSISLILEASKSGGATSDVLLAAARDARELKNLERERKLNMVVYTMVIYVTFFVFLFVVGVLYSQFVPEILNAASAAQDSSLQDSSFVSADLSLDQFRTFYFTAAMVQAVGNGVIAGLMGSGSAPLGLRHSFIMAVSTYISFGFVMA